MNRDETMPDPRHHPRAVLYTRDLEPITVIDVPPRLWHLLTEVGRARLHVPAKLDLRPAAGEIERTTECRIIELYAERFRYRGVETLMLFVDDEELALALRPSFLPGQQSAVNAVRNRALIEGFVNALRGHG